MPLRIKLARVGVRNDPTYHIVTLDARKRRNAKPIETLGVYVPRPLLHIHRPSLTQLVKATSSTAPAPAQKARLANGLAEGGEREVRKDVRWDVDRLRYWIGVGAQPTSAVLKLMKTGGFVNHFTDLDQLRTQTTAPGTRPPPLGLTIASTKRGPAAAMARFRRRGVLPHETEVLQDGSLRLPGSITTDGQPLTLTPEATRARLALARRLLLRSPTHFLTRRHPAPPLHYTGAAQARQRRDPARWKVLRRRRAAAVGLVDPEWVRSGLRGLKAPEGRQRDLKPDRGGPPGGQIGVRVEQAGPETEVKVKLVEGKARVRAASARGADEVPAASPGGA